MNLRLDWATHEAAKFACENWHYSKCLPVGKLVKVGVWERDKFIGVVVFGRGAAPKLASSFGLKITEVAELVRIALTKHETPVTRIVSIAIKKLKKSFNGIRLIVSFADPSQDHHGGIYQGGNWVYYGISGTTGGFEYLVGNKWITCRSIGARFGTRVTSEVEKRLRFSDKRKAPRKHRYAMGLDSETHKTILRLSKPYPKRAVSKDNVAVTFQVTEGGAIPTTALHSDKL